MPDAGSNPVLFPNIRLITKRQRMFSENIPSSISKVAIIGLLGFVAWLTILNIYDGVVHKPQYFVLSLVGLSLFLLSKFSLFKKGHLVTFGTKYMDTLASNFYRVGYWLMVVGVLGTFFGPSI